jgi:hypothetical protein
MAAFVADEKVFDVEKGGAHAHPSSDIDSSIIVPDDSGAIHGEQLLVGDSWQAKVQRFAHRAGIENRGIERVPSDERTDTDQMKIGSMVCAH